jgi:hypothetical protein
MRFGRWGRQDDLLEIRKGLDTGVRKAYWAVYTAGQESPRPSRETTSMYSVESVELAATLLKTAEVMRRSYSLGYVR